eukprot:708525-Prorocentrum_minimum.AAC.2
MFACTRAASCERTPHAEDTRVCGRCNKCRHVSNTNWDGMSHFDRHFGAGTGTFLAIQVIAAARGEALRACPRLQWAIGMLPYVVYTHNKSA